MPDLPDLPLSSADRETYRAVASDGAPWRGTTQRAWSTSD